MPVESDQVLPALGEVVEPPPLRHRPLVTVTVAFALGIVAARYLSLGVGQAAGMAGACLLGLAVLRLNGGENCRSALVILLIGAAGAANQAHQSASARARAERSLSALLGPGRTLCTIHGTVTGEITVVRTAPLLSAAEVAPWKASTLCVEAESVESNGHVTATRGAVTVRVKGELSGIGHGDRVSVLGWASPLRTARAADRYAVSKGLVARMAAACPDAVRRGKSSPGSVLRLLYGLKQSFRDQIDERFRGEGAAVLKAVLLGDRERLARPLAASFEKSGTMHILSISGLHVGIVYVAIAWLCRMLLIQRWPRRLIVLAVVLAYAVTTGFRPATIRATLMIVLFETGMELQFRRDPLNTVAAAALCLLVWHPPHLFEAGFQLTFVAVTGILLFAGDLAGLLRRHPDELERLADREQQSRSRRAVRRVWGGAAAALGTCAAATLVVTPLQAYYFNIVTPVSVIATALLVPIVLLLISLGFVFLAAGSLVPVLAGPLALVLSGLTALFAGTIRLAAGTPLGHVFVAPPAAAWVWAGYGALLLVAARRWLGVRTARAVAAPAVLLVGYLAWRAAVCPGPDLSATFVDVGHGAGVILTRGRETVVYDCGSGTPMSTYDVGKGPVALCLWEKGVKRIDALFLSHTDADHVNGALSLADRFPVGRVLVHESFLSDEVGRCLAEEFAARGIPVVEVGAGDAVRLGGLSCRVLWPPKGPSSWQLSKVNDRSLVVRVRCGDRSLLLTGDIEQAGMGGLLATQADLRSEVLYVPHHGAKEPVLAELVRAVGASHAVISGDRADTQPEVIRLFRGALLYRTYADGTITLRSTGAGYSASSSAFSRSALGCGLKGR